MTPWEFQARADEMKEVVDKLTAIQQRETKRFNRMMWASRALNLLLLIVAAFNLVSFVEHVCRR